MTILVPGGRGRACTAVRCCVFHPLVTSAQHVKLTFIVFALGVIVTTPVIAFLTMKGGVGKTTLAANITRALADQKKRKILLIDGDAQCNLSQVFFDSDVIEGAPRSLYQAFDNRGRFLFAGDLKTTVYPALHGFSPHGSLIDFIIGSFDTFELNATASAARRSGAAERFKAFIDHAKREYDLIIIDTNPSATFVTMQALENSNFLVAPITFDAFSLQGIHLVVHPRIHISGSPIRLDFASWPTKFHAAQAIATFGEWKGKKTK